MLQCLLLAYGGPGRTVALFEPTYALHRHIARLTGTAVVAGPRRDDFALDLDAVGRGAGRVADPVITFLCSPNNPTGRADRLDEIAAVARLVPGLVVVDEAYGQFAPSSALELRRRDPAARPGTWWWSGPSPRPGRWPAPGSGYLVADPEVVAACERVALPYHLDAAKQAAGRLALRYVDEMERRVAAVAEERGRIAAALADLPVETWPSDANFLLFRPDGQAGRRGVVRISWPLGARARLFDVAGPHRLPAGDGRLPEENDRFLAALTKACDEHSASTPVPT